MMAKDVVKALKNTAMALTKGGHSIGKLCQKGHSIVEKFLGRKIQL